MMEYVKQLTAAMCVWWVAYSMMRESVDWEWSSKRQAFRLAFIVAVFLLIIVQ